MLPGGLMNRFVPFLCLSAALTGLAGVQPAPLVEAGGPATSANPPPARWLLVVNTSAAMERRARAVEGVVGELLSSGMRGELQPRDQIGLWTFNRELQAGAAPLQTWMPARSNHIAGRTVNVLSLQPFAGTPRFATVLAQLEPLIAQSHRLTVLFFTDATATFTNTPWDAELNAAIAAEKAALEKTRMPLVIVLRSCRGQLTGWSVTLAPWPVEFPPFPAAPAVVARAEPPPAPARPSGPPREIHIGPVKPPEPAPAITSLPAPPKVETLTATLAPPVTVGQPPPTGAAPAPSAPPSIADVTPPARNADASAAPAPPTEEAPQPPTASVPAPVAAAQTVAPPALTNALPADGSRLTTLIVTNLAATNGVAAAQAPPVPRERPARPASPAPTVAAFAASPEARLPRGNDVNWLLIGGVGLLSVASGLAVWLALRSRRPAPASFITRSMARR